VPAAANPGTAAAAAADHDDGDGPVGTGTEATGSWDSSLDEGDLPWDSSRSGTGGSGSGQPLVLTVQPLQDEELTSCGLRFVSANFAAHGRWVRCQTWNLGALRVCLLLRGARQGSACVCFTCRSQPWAVGAACLQGMCLLLLCHMCCMQLWGHVCCHDPRWCCKVTQHCCAASQTCVCAMLSDLPASRACST
jgi:hypothetical protein